jgi:stage III sporulation protein AA
MGYGIEVATRTLGAQVIVCDEIGSEEDVRAILAVQSGGVPLVASAHAAGLAELLGRQTISGLHRAGIFGAYLGLCRGKNPSVYLAEDANACL